MTKALTAASSNSTRLGSSASARKAAGSGSKSPRAKETPSERPITQAAPIQAAETHEPAQTTSRGRMLRAASAGIVRKYSKLPWRSTIGQGQSSG